MVRKKVKKRIVSKAITVFDNIFKDYKKSVNMSFSELKRWAKTELSKQSKITRMAVKRNLELLRTPKSKWQVKHVRWAIKTVRFVRRVKQAKKGKVIAKGFSKRDLMLKNNAFDPFKAKKK